MKIGTMSVVVGDASCNAKCPFCVSKMTASASIMPCTEDIDYRRFDIACRFAAQSGVSTVLLTGTGEPTLHPELIKKYLTSLYTSRKFPFIELQTNGIKLIDMKKDLEKWYRLGLTLVCLSVTHYDAQTNSELMPPNGNLRLPIWETVSFLHEIGFSVRLNCTMVKGGIDSKEEVGAMVDLCRLNEVEQLTFRDVTTPTKTNNPEVTKWVLDNGVKYRTKGSSSNQSGNVMVQEYLYENDATMIMTLPHGAYVWDCQGQNVSNNNCLTTTLAPNEIRQLIFVQRKRNGRPRGQLRYDWVYEGAIIL